MQKITLKPKKEQSLLRRHPWVFSGALTELPGDMTSGQTVKLVDTQGNVMGVGAYSPASQIAVRMWAFEDIPIDEAFFETRLAHALAARDVPHESWTTQARRLVNAEADRLPGLMVDRYANTLVCQFLTAGTERWKATLVAALQKLMPGCALYERSDADARQKEDLPETVGHLAGPKVEGPVTITEHEARYLVDVIHGHKTGFYLDQRINRQRVATYAQGKDVLNCFSYTGGFSVMAQKHGAAHTTNIESSSEALVQLKLNMQANEIAGDQNENINGNVFEVLRGFRDRRRSFDMIILDPPKFAESRKSVDKALRGYKDINLLALKLLKPDGILATFSCSGLVDDFSFQRALAFASKDAARDVQILEKLGAAPDHPSLLSFPEGSYLKGLICKAL